MKVSCDPECGFMVQSHNKGELIKIVKGHVKDIHKMNTTDLDVIKKIEIV